MVNTMKRKIILKLRSSNGESLTETLVALLIAAIALVMLASMISSTTRIVTQSKTKMTEYYKANKTVAAQTGEGTDDASVTITDDASDTINGQQYSVTAYLNQSFSSTPIASYRLNLTGTATEQNNP